METNQVLLKAAGRITADNVDEIEAGFLRSIGDRKEVELVIDMGEVSYISSAGLRMMMRLKKQFASLTVVHVSPELYDIFSVTGFTQLLHIVRAYREISLEGLPVIGEGVTATVYRLDQERIVKIYKEGIREEELLREHEMTRQAFLAGVPTMISYETVKAGELLGAVYEAFNYDTLESIYVDAADERRQELTKLHAKAVREMCEVAVDPEEFFSFKADLQEKLARERTRLDAPTLRAYQNLIDAIPDDHTFVHGDCHMGNLMMDSEKELKVIDLGISGYGNPVFSLSAVCLYRLFGELFPAQAYQQKTRLSPQEGKKLWERFIAAYFESAPTRDHDRIENCVYLYCCLFSSLNYVGTPLVSDETFLLLSGKVREAYDGGLDTCVLFDNLRG